MVVVAIIGVLAAVAIPAFLKYIKRAKTTEALLNIRRMWDSSVSYVEGDYASSDGDILGVQFPAGNPVTPALSLIGIRKFEPDQTIWQTATWNALNFGVSDPHFYAYQYDSEGTYGGATFTATAFGNLDGDDTYSTFLRVGIYNIPLAVRGGVAVFQARALE
jgi:type IV pilus assembly protein PilA